ncbi:MAG: hypothetical protein WCP28_22295, partial [Actinomycetes bacterium]
AAPAPAPTAAAPAPTAPARALASGDGGLSGAVGLAGFAHVALIMAAEPPILAGQVQSFSLAISGVGFESGANVEVRVGTSIKQSTQASVVGALDLQIPGVQLTSSEPGQTIVASGLGPSGAPIVLTGSIPPVPKAGGPMVIVTWVVAGIAVLTGGWWLWRRFAAGGQSEDSQPTSPST